MPEETEVAAGMWPGGAPLIQMARRIQIRYSYSRSTSDTGPSRLPPTAAAAGVAGRLAMTNMGHCGTSPKVQGEAEMGRATTMLKQKCWERKEQLT